MKKQIIFCLIGLVFFTDVMPAQDNSPVLLPVPEKWKFEKIEFPLDFAPDIKYKGFEELRFAPGMFDTTSTNYFTYVFALSIDNFEGITKEDLKIFLLKYYQGLCVAVAKSKKLKVDTSLIKVNVKKLKRKKASNIHYIARTNFLDVFTNGNEIELNIKIEVINDKKNNKGFLLALVSPKKPGKKTWKSLYEAKNDIKKTSSIFNSKKGLN